jgi:hypothetical protein
LDQQKHSCFLRLSCALLFQTALEASELARDLRALASFRVSRKATKPHESDCNSTMRFQVDDVEDLASTNAISKATHEENALLSAVHIEFRNGSLPFELAQVPTCTGIHEHLQDTHLGRGLEDSIPFLSG